MLFAQYRKQVLILCPYYIPISAFQGWMAGQQNSQNNSNRPTGKNKGLTVDSISILHLRHAIRRPNSYLVKKTVIKIWTKDQVVAMQPGKKTCLMQKKPKNPVTSGRRDSNSFPRAEGQAKRQNNHPVGFQGTLSPCSAKKGWLAGRKTEWANA